jgi:hypothetical protein
MGEVCSKFITAHVRNDKFLLLSIRPGIHFLSKYFNLPPPCLGFPLLPSMAVMGNLFIINPIYSHQIWRMAQKQKRSNTQFSHYNYKYRPFLLERLLWRWLCRTCKMLLHQKIMSPLCTGGAVVDLNGFSARDGV